MPDVLTDVPAADTALREALRDAVARAPLASQHTLSLRVMQAFHRSDEDLLRLYAAKLPEASPALISLACSFARALGDGRRPDAGCVEALSIAAGALGWTDEAMASGEIDPAEAAIGSLAVEHSAQREQFRSLVLERGITDSDELRGMLDQMARTPAAVAEGCL